MEKLLVCLLVIGMAAKAQTCPKRCVCQVLSPNLATLCAKKGLLFVPPNIDRNTVELRLADNFVTSVKRKDFANMTRLVDLTLSRNTISYITPHAFADLENLRALHLNSNRLTRIANDTFSGMSKLHHLILNNNQLTLISLGAFNDLLALEELDLSYNNLETIPWEAIQRMTSLHTLGLDHNMIDYIPEGTFSLLQKLNRLDVTSNKLQKLPPDPLFQRAQMLANTGLINPSTFALSFGGNPLHCNCELLWLRRLTREDDLETCASPQHLSGRYFWSIPEEEFLCEPPLIISHSPETRVLEGQQVALRCKARGDPMPAIHWISPEGKLVSNSSRTVVYTNGTLHITITTVKDTGSFTCISSNPAGEANQRVELMIIKLPHISNSTNNIQESDPGSSDISTSTRAGANGGNQTADVKTSMDKRVVIAEATSSTALIKFNFQRNIPGIRMFQIQYNGTYDDSLVYRMIPPTSKNFLVNNLAAGTQYDLCVLAIYDDGITSLTATRVVGCVQFTTESEYLRCHFMQSQFLGGTMIIIIGGIIVASVLVFIIILMIRYKVCNGSDAAKGRMSGGSTTNVHSQTNGSQSQGCTVTPSVSKQALVALGSAAASEASAGVGGSDRGGMKGPPPDTLTHSSETTTSPSLAECSTATSQLSQGWTATGASGGGGGGASASSTGTLKGKRKAGAPKPAAAAPIPGPTCSTTSGSGSTSAKSPEARIETLLDAETQNTNRNNSTALQLQQQQLLQQHHQYQQQHPQHMVAGSAATSGSGSGSGSGSSPSPGPSHHQSPLLPPARFKDTPILRRVHPRPSGGAKYMTLPVEGPRVKRRYSLNEDLSKHHCYVGSGSKFGQVWSGKRSLSMNGMLLQPDLESGRAYSGSSSSAEWILESTV